MILSYYQGNDLWGSDHYPIFFKCAIEYKLYEKKSNRITSNRTDWRKYVGLLEDREYELESNDFGSLSEEDKYRFIIDAIKKAAFEATGKKWSLVNGRIGRCDKSRYQGIGRKGWRRRNPIEWWDEECDRLVNDRVRACRAYRRYKCLANHIEKKRCVALVRKAVRRKKRKYFKSFTARLDRFVDMGYVWNRMNVFKNRNNTKEWNLFGDKEYVEMARKEISKVAPQWTEEAPIEFNIYEERLSIRNNRWGLNSIFSRAELDRAFSLSRDRSSPRSIIKC